MDRMILGDCWEVLKTFPDSLFDAVITDPPYGVSGWEWDHEAPIYWDELFRVCKPDAPIIIFATMPYTASVVMSGRKYYRHRLVWNKKRAASYWSAKVMPMPVVEDILVFGKKSPHYYPVMRRQKERRVTNKTRKNPDVSFHFALKQAIATVDYRTDKAYPKNLISHVPTRFQKVHPHEKPIPILAWLIAHYTKPGDLILDPFAGSGSTGIACKRVNDARFVDETMLEFDSGDRHYVLIEKDINYFIAMLDNVSLKSDKEFNIVYG